MYSPRSQESVNNSIVDTTIEEIPRPYCWIWDPIFDISCTQLWIRGFWLVWLLFILIAGGISYLHMGFLVAFTMYGVYFTVITFILLFIYSLLYQLINHHSLIPYLKPICLLFFSISLTWEVIITIVFWTVLSTKFRLFESLFQFCDQLYHIFPLLFLCIDFLLNKWILEYRHINF